MITIINSIAVDLDWNETSEVALKIDLNFTFIRTKSKWINSLAKVFGEMQTMNENIQTKEPKKSVKSETVFAILEW